MNTYQEVHDVVTLHIEKEYISEFSINSFSGINYIGRLYDLKHKFYIIIQIRIPKNKLEEFEAKLINVIEQENNGYGECLYHILVTKDELVQIVHDIDDLYSPRYYVHYYTVNYTTFIKATNYISENFKVNTQLIDPRSPIDESSFYAVIVCNERGKLDTFNELFLDHCDSIEKFNTFYPHHETLHAKNVDEHFMTKFKLISDSLQSSIDGFIVGIDFYKRFEDRSL